MTASSGAILLAGRVLFAVFFVSAAWGHIQGHASRVEYSRAARMPFPYVAGWPSGLWLAAGAASVAVGIWPDIGTLMLGAFVLPAGLRRVVLELHDDLRRALAAQRGAGG